MLTKESIKDFGRRAVNISDKDAQFYIDNNYILGFYKESELFRRHDLLSHKEWWNLPKIGKTVLVEDKEGHFYSAYLDYREWKDIDEKLFDWFLYDSSYLAKLEDSDIIAWYEIPEV